MVDIPQTDVGTLDVLFVGVSERRPGHGHHVDEPQEQPLHLSGCRSPGAGWEAEYEQPESESPEASEELEPALAPLV